MDGPVPNDPLDIAEPAQSAALPTEEGFVYGSAPKQPTDPPNVDLLFEYAGVPGPREGGLPFTLEWYAGAKDRAKARDAEIERLNMRKCALHTKWTELIDEDIAKWVGRVDATSTVAPDGTPPDAAIRGLAELLARASQESPDNIDHIARLEVELEKAELEDDQVVHELGVTRACLLNCADVIRAREAEAIAEEEGRLEARRIEMARRAEAEEELRRQEAQLRGEDPDNEDHSGNGHDTLEPAPLPPLPAAPIGGPAAPVRFNPSAGLVSTTASPVPLARSPSPTPPRLSRGGLAMELPPLPDPPRPGSGDVPARHT